MRAGATSCSLKPLPGRARPHSSFAGATVTPRKPPERRASTDSREGALMPPRKPGHARCPLTPFAAAGPPTRKPLIKRGSTPFPVADGSFSAGAATLPRVPHFERACWPPLPPAVAGSTPLSAICGVRSPEAHHA